MSDDPRPHNIGLHVTQAQWDLLCELGRLNDRAPTTIAYEMFETGLERYES